MSRLHSIDDPLTASVIGAFFEVYNTLRFGFLESVYTGALCAELRHRGHDVIREAPVDVYYRGESVAQQRIDLLVDTRLVVEVKATRELHPSARRQLLNYLRATRLPRGLILHFGIEARPHRVWLEDLLEENSRGS